MMRRLWGDGKHDDTKALLSLWAGKWVIGPNGKRVRGYLPPGSYYLASLPPPSKVRGE